MKTSKPGSGRWKRILLPPPPMLLAMTLSLLLSACSSPALMVDYNSYSDHIRLENRRLTHIRREYHYPPDRPMVATPDSMSSLVLLDGVPVGRAKINTLSGVINSSGFWDLKAAYGAPEGQRYYPATIRVQEGRRIHEVTFRSNPSYEGPPAAFTQVEAAIKALLPE